ncbi:1-phosphatidylinositol phosphodiesterase precursor [Periconia macrospinosa]|uniref:1-phosphatidylinositol phosphodiesterase n=1 Tax=Periconia macrospinosa TaxID=97972 RepID=A0A2V1DH07_9PLEO|nr:1-phosphatidylinositol phosphodiesterase precursor [Periconia macrospinosa]
MAIALTIRNLTPVLFTIKGLETFEDPNAVKYNSASFIFKTKTTAISAPTAPELGDHAESFNHESLNVELKPFESFTLRAKNATASEKKRFFRNMVMRITIECAFGQRHRIDFNPSYTHKASKRFTNLTSDPSQSYTGLYHPTKPVPHLVVHTNHLQNYARWMKALPSNLPLSAISLPGTHNSHTHYRALPSVRCQISSVEVQLEHGIRFLDIRVQPSHASDSRKKDLFLVHGAFPISLTGVKYFEPVLETCYSFLTENPSETILISLKREGVGSATDQHLAEILDQHYIRPNPSRWYTGTRIPYLGDVRGKLVLIRRYDIQKPTTPVSISSATSLSSLPACGLDATAWPHNSTHALHGPFCVQDFCEVQHPSSIPLKLQFANEHLVRSSQTTAFIPGVNTDSKNPVPPGPLYLNFLSGSNFWNKGTWPEKIAKVVNRGFEEWICTGHALDNSDVTMGKLDMSNAIDLEDVDGIAGVRGKAKCGDGGTGIVIMDNVGEGEDWDLIALIIGLNMGVLMVMQEVGKSV